MKVKANLKELSQYRCIALGIDKDDFRKLQAGGSADIDAGIVKKYPHVFIKEAKK